jgi:hypothetical protein
MQNTFYYQFGVDRIIRNQRNHFLNQFQLKPIKQIFHIHSIQTQIVYVDSKLNKIIVESKQN